MLAKWELVALDIKALQAKSTKKNDKHHRAANARFIGWLQDLAAYRALDPACGSGNFLYLALKCLKDIEHHSHLQAADLGLDRQTDLVTGPHNVLGIELNEYAAELARVTVWIGELQWRIDHGYEFKTNPVLEPLDHIECRDALLRLPSGAVEAEWPRADVVIGNPPFLGGSKKRGELGAGYFEQLNDVYAKRVPGGADLVCYWFEKARQQMQVGQLQAAGLVATQSIRAGSNRAVLSALTTPIHIFNAWADEPWVNDGAAVRVSLVCFGLGERSAVLNGQAVQQIHADLSAGEGLDLTLAQVLPANGHTVFEGTKKYGAFDVSGEVAREWLKLPNPHGRSNAEVVKPWRNGQGVTQRPSDTWIVDFGTDRTQGEASLFEAPFRYVEGHVLPERLLVRRERTRRLWWLHEEARVSMRKALGPLSRYLATPRVAKHRNFVFIDAAVLPDTRLNVIARADDTTFGILSSRMHEVWSLAQASMHGVGNDPTYNAKSCFETFPFPPGLTPADTAHQQTEVLADSALIPADLPEKYEQKMPQALMNQAQTAMVSVKVDATAIAQAAKRLNDLRQAWLNPPEWTQTVPEVVPLGMSTSPYPDRTLARPGFEKQLAERTLTKLYNQRPAWLAQAHAALDAAVAAAYGWADYTPAMPDDEILKRLLALNLAVTATPAPS